MNVTMQLLDVAVVVVFFRLFLRSADFIDYANEVINFHSRKCANKVSKPIPSMKLCEIVCVILDFNYA